MADSLHVCNSVICFRETFFSECSGGLHVFLGVFFVVRVFPTGAFPNLALTLTWPEPVLAFMLVRALICQSLLS